MILLVEPPDRGQRLDRYLAGQIPDFSRSKIQQWIRDGLIQINDQPADAADLVQTGQTITIQPPPEPSIEPENLPLQIVWQDASLAVIEKPPAMTVHPGAGEISGTLVNALLHHLPSLSAVSGPERPGIVHRLDRDTSGLLVIAKTDAAHHHLARQFAERTTLKIYQALVEGHPAPEEGILKGAIARHPVHRKKMAIRPDGRPAQTDYRVLEFLQGAALVECRLHSGRTHQIRVHLKSIGHGLLGDTLYHLKSKISAPRLMLHAWKLGFSHPDHGDWREFTSPLPPDFVMLLDRLQPNGKE